MSYADFIARKGASVSATPVPHGDLAPHLFAYQADLVRWALRRGRAAIFADTGLGKSAMQIEWSRHVSAHGRVLILAPLAVAEQTVAEAARWGTEVRYLRDDDGASPIVITNYEMFSHFDPAAFVGAVIDESSILKAHDGRTRNAIINGFGRARWKLACTATPAPNDHTELGNHAEFLGICTMQEMLAEYFVRDGGSTQDWRLKGHARDAFWRWVASWGAVVKRPSDLGHPDDGFVLPPLRMHERIVPVDHDDAKAMGMLFLDDARTLSEQRATRRATMQKRVDLVVSLVGGEAWTPTKSELADSSTCGSGQSRTASVSPPTELQPPRSATLEPESSTPPTLSGKRRRGGKPASGSETTPSVAEISGSQGTASPEPTTIASSESKAAAALSADATSASTAATDAGSTSTTAIAPGECAASSAQTATSASGSSPTTLSDLNAPPLTSGSRPEKWIVWCELNAEQDAIAAALGDRCVSVYGSLTPEEKVARERMWRESDVPVLLTKISVFGFGMNWQHCQKQIFAGVSHSYEGTYQAIRRCWRFGQKRPVDVYVIRAETEGAIVANLKRKEADAERMSESVASQMRDVMRAEISSARHEVNDYVPAVRMRVPAWLGKEAS